LKTGGFYAKFIEEIITNYLKVAQNLCIFTFPKAEVKAFCEKTHSGSSLIAGTERISRAINESLG
jgi:hypothetical protein